MGVEIKIKKPPFFTEFKKKCSINGFNIKNPKIDIK
jgi:hypothetical protein